MLLVRPDGKQFQALARLVRTPEAEVLLDLLDTELSRLQSHLLDSSGETTLKLQGMARSITQVIALLRDAPLQAERSR